MTDLSAYSDAELEAIAGGSPVAQAMPALIAQESGGRAGVLGPQTPYGRAEGMTQMLPATAREMATKLGVPWRPELMRASSPEGAAYQQQLGQAYLEQGLAETGNMEDAFRYYHGGPNRQMWGPKTNAYAQQVSARMGGEQPPADDWSGMSDEELMAIAGQGAAPKPVPGYASTSVATNPDGSLEIGPGAPRPVPRPAPRAVAAKPQKDQALGFTMGVTPAMPRMGQIGDALARGMGPMGGIIPSVVGMAGKFAGEQFQKSNERQLAAGAQPGMIGQIAGGVAATLPTMALGPIAGGAASGFLLSEGKNPLEVGRDMAIGGLTGKIADDAIRLLGRIPKTMNPAQLKTARDAAYQAVDNAGVQFTPKAYDDLLAGISDEVTAAKLNPMRHPKAASMLDEIQSLRGKPMTLSELDQLRQVIRRDVASAPDEAERFFGQKMIANIDEFIQAATPDQVMGGDPKTAAAAIKTARDLHTRIKKLETFETALGRADLRAASTGSGGNVDNATRQNVRGVIEKTRNLTPAERQAAEKVVRGGGVVQNTLRFAGKMSPTTGGLMGLLNFGGALAAPQIAIPLAVGTGAAKIGADLMTKRNVDDLLRLIINGGRPLPRTVPSAVIRRPVAAGAVAATAAATPVSAKERK
jgi:hypothetical protein